MKNRLYHTLCQFEGAHIARNLYPFLEDFRLIPDTKATLELLIDGYCNIDTDLTSEALAGFMNSGMSQWMKKYLLFYLFKQKNNYKFLFIKVNKLLIIENMGMFR